MTAYQVTRIEAAEEGTRYVMNTGDAVLLLADGRARFLNKAGRGFSSAGRFAHIAHAMRKAVERATA